MSGSNPPDRRIRLFDFLERYVEDYLKVKDAKSWRQELGRLRRIRRHFGDVWMHEIHSSDIEHFLADLLREGLKPATANRYRARLSSMTRKARAWGFRDDNPLEFIELFKERRLGDRYLEPEEFRHLLEACDEDLRCLVLVAAYTGMRRGELLALRREDVDLERGYLLVRADVPISKVAKILGHKELATTQRYAHLSDESLFEAVERIVLPHQRSCESAQTIPSARSG
jgi:integrase